MPHRSSKVVLPLAVCAAIIGVVGCGRAAHNAVERLPARKAAAQPTVDAYDAPGIPMVRRLELVGTSLLLDDMLSGNHEKAARLHDLLTQEKDADLRALLLPQYAEQLLLAGESEEAIQQYEVIEDLIARNRLALTQPELDKIRMAHAVAYLRLGEQENCVLNHTSESCLLPIQGDGIHKAQRGSRGAVKLLIAIL